jgi:hypothetical protein
MNRVNPYHSRYGGQNRFPCLSDIAVAGPFALPRSLLAATLTLLSGGFQLAVEAGHWKRSHKGRYFFLFLFSNLRLSSAFGIERTRSTRDVTCRNQTMVFSEPIIPHSLE